MDDSEARHSTMNGQSSSAVIDTLEEGPGHVQHNRPNNQRPLTYGINETCPVYIAALYGIQNVLENAAGVVGVVFLIHSSICGGTDKVFFSELVSAYIFLIGFGSLLQVTFGVRLPILEGIAYSYVTPVMAFMATQTCEIRCSDLPPLNANETGVTQEPCVDKPWKKPLLEISGGLMCAAAVQTVLGLTGAAGFLLSYISSLTIAVTVGLLGLSLASVVTYSAGSHWGIVTLTFGLYILFALLLANVTVPLPTWSSKRGFHTKRLPIFRTFPSLLSLGLAWLFCYILTEHTSQFSSDPSHPTYHARTDIKVDTFHDADWFYIPYPGQYGLPEVGVGIFVGFLGSVIASTIESIGDYYAFSRACQLPPPPKHTVNRGIAVEGIISMLCGASGVCLGTSSYSYVAGIVTVTGMGSRMGWQIVSLIFIAAGLAGKLGAALSMIPDPVIAGFNIVGIGMVAAVGLSCLQFVDLKSVRNLVILGSSLMIGLMVPQYMNSNPGVIDTGSEKFDQVLTIVLTTSMTVGGIVSFILDNIVPGTDEERGLLTHSKMLQASFYSSEPLEKQIKRGYDIPYVSDWLRRRACCRYMPFMPSYDENILPDLPSYPCGARHSPEGSAAAAGHTNESYEPQ